MSRNFKDKSELYEPIPCGLFPVGTSLVHRLETLPVDTVFDSGHRMPIAFFSSWVRRVIRSSYASEKTYLEKKLSWKVKYDTRSMYSQESMENLRCKLPAFASHPRHFRGLCDGASERIREYL